MEQKIKLFKEIANKEEVAAKLTATGDLNEILAVLADNGLQVSAEELTDILNALNGSADGELDETALEDVAGGGLIKNLYVIIKHVLPIIGGPIKPRRR